MSISKRAVILALVGMGAAMVTALAAVGPDTKRNPAPAANAAAPLANAGCPQEPWPFGCQWREPSLKLAHKAHTSHAGQPSHHPRPHVED